MATEQPTDYSERQLEVAGWPVKVTSYKLGAVYRATVDNVSPGAWIARSDGATKLEAETTALDRARQLLEKTKRHPASH